MYVPLVVPYASTRTQSAVNVAAPLFDSHTYIGAATVTACVATVAPSTM
jgi:hypothetical protein